MSSVRRLVHADGAPAPVGPYSHAVVVGETVYCSGQLGVDPSTNAFAGPDVAAQTDRALLNLSEVLSAAGSSLSDVVKATVFLVDMGDFSRMNEVYARHLGSVKPARSTVAVKELPKGAKVEIEVVAHARRSRMSGHTSL